MRLFFDNYWIFNAIYILPAGCRLLCLPKKCEINFLFTHFLCNKLHNAIRTLILKDGIVHGNVRISNTTVASIGVLSVGLLPWEFQKKRTKSHGKLYKACFLKMIDIHIEYSAPTWAANLMLLLTNTISGQMLRIWLVKQSVKAWMPSLRLNLKTTMHSFKLLCWPITSGDTWK